jgi:glycoside/pentoside/hexuronide:cation symporter, GPH family
MINVNSSQSPIQEVQSTSKKIAYSSGSFSVQLIAQAFATYAVFYYVDILGVRPGLISIAMVIHGIFNAVLNPLLGYISDRTRSRWGRRIPYVMFGMIPLAAVFTLIWSPIGQGQELFWYFLIIVLIYDVLFVLVVLNWTALFPEMFSTLKDRTFVSSWRQMLGILGMILGVSIPPMLYSQIGWSAMGVLFGIVTLTFFAVSLFGSKERAQHRAPAAVPLIPAFKYTLSSKSFLTYVIGTFFAQLPFALLPAAIPFFVKYVLVVDESSSTLITGALFVVALPMAYIWGILGNKWGPRKAIMIAVCIFGATLSGFALVQGITQTIVIAAFAGAGLAGLIVLMDVMLAEIIDEDERRTGERREGMYFGMNGFIIRWGVSLQAIIMGLILEGTKYDSNLAVQSEAVQFGIRMMMSGIPMASLFIAFVFYWFYPMRGKPNPLSNDKGQAIRK